MSICYIFYFLNLIFSSFAYIFCALFVYCFKFKPLTVFPFFCLYSLRFAIFLIYKILRHVIGFYLVNFFFYNLMTFIYFACEFYKISNAIAYKLILDFEL